MEKVSNYRVKVDLSQFFEDVRKLSYVFINEKSISHILHLRERIKDVFGITRPFYLTSSEGVYLPLNEDVRIVGEEETITVCPGSVNHNCLTVWKEIGVKCNGKPLSTIQVPKDLEKNNQQSTPLKKSPKINGFDGKNDCPNQSVIVTESEGQGRSSPPEDSDTDVAQDPKSNPQNTTLNLFTIPPKKRRRCRKRKSKHSPEVPETQKIITTPFKSISLPLNSSKTPETKPKHLKFNWEDNNDDKIDINNGICSARVPELNTLLNLKNSQFPVTFLGQKTKQYDGKSQLTDSDANRDIQSPMNNGNNDTLNDKSSNIIDLLNVNPLDYPIYKEDFYVGDVVAFRILKIGSDYSPTVSGYIVAEAVFKDPEPSTYSFKIISGEDQLKSPEGKFSIIDEEEIENSEHIHHETGIHVLTKGELLELRLIHRQST